MRRNEIMPTKTNNEVSQTSTVKRVPILRFPVFSGEWKEKRLEGMLNFTVDNRGKTPPVESYGIPLIEVNAIGEKNIDYSKIKKYVNETTYKKWFRKYLKNKDILFSTVGATAICSVYSDDKKSVIAQNIVGLRFSKEDPDFMFYLLTEKKNNHKFKKIEMGAVQPSVKVSQMIKLKFCLPNFLEQQKIAEFLGLTDAWIENLRAQKTSLESYKKAIMQKLFSQEIRFKDDDGQDFPDWMEKKLGELGAVITGATPPTINKEYYGSDFPWITPTDIDSEKNIYTSTKLLTRKGLDKGRFVPKNSLLVTCIASIGKNAILRVDGSCNQQINAISPNDQNNVDFLYYLLEKNKNTLIRFAGAGGMQMLNKKDFSGLKFEIPSLLEQQKIADLLTSIDKNIASKQKQITRTEEWKRGLMQGLFV